MSNAAIVEANTKETTPVVEKTMTLEEQIDRLVAQFKADLLSILSSTTTTATQEAVVDVPVNPIVDIFGKKWKNAQGQLYRLDGPALELVNGDQVWYENGNIHRDDDKPAVECVDGCKAWYQHGLRHRAGDQPALIEANGDQYWYQNNRLHRADDKPAIIRANGEQEWWVDGICVKKLLFKTG